MKGIISGTLVEIVATIGGLLIIMIVAYPLLKSLLFESTETGQCQMSVMISAITKKLTLGFGDIPPECKMKRLTITLQDLDAQKDLATQAIEAYARTGDKEAQEEFPNNEQGKLKWALQRKVANEMLDCHNKGLRAKIHLGGLDWFEKLTKQPGEYLCIVCTRIRFDPNIAQLFRQNSFLINPWLQSNNAKEKTYYTLLTEEQHHAFAERIKLSYFSLDEPLAVVFISGKRQLPKLEDPYRLEQVIGGGVTLAPYEKLQTSLGFGEYFASPVPGGELSRIQHPELTGQYSKCTTIIGD